MENLNARVVKIVVLDDHPLIRSAFSFSMQSVPDIELVATCATRYELFEALNSQHVDVVVLDYLLGNKEIDGLAMIKQIVMLYPSSSILLSSSVESPAIVHVALRAGVGGFIGKSKNFDDIIDAIRQVAAGKIFLSPDMQYEIDLLKERDREMQQYIQPPEAGAEINMKLQDLTPRELEVVRCYLNGMSNSQIAEKFSRSAKTISGQKKTALRKLGLRNDAELFRFRDYFCQ